MEEDKNKGLVKRLPEDDEEQMSDDEIQKILSEQIVTAMQEEKKEEEIQPEPEKKRKLKRWHKILIGIGAGLLVVAGIVCYFAFTKQGRDQVLESIGEKIYDKAAEYTERVEPTQIAEPVESTESQEQQVVTINPVIPHPEADVVNILLIGVEQYKGAHNTDAMIVASMNRKTKDLTLVSLMRDLYIEIPGYPMNKLNSVVATGGMELLYQTIEHNFGLHLDGYISVNYEEFEKIVNLLGGVDVTLTKQEAHYLNHTNYISNKAYRTVVEGRQVMNGNQALGYCRIRKRSTGKETDDYGRTARQRAVLQSMYSRLKQKDLIGLMNFMSDVIDTVKFGTDIPKENFTDYVKEIDDLNVTELKQYRIPANGTFTGEMVHIKNAKRASSVLVPKDMEETKRLVHEYIYGVETTQAPTPAQ